MAAKAAISNGSAPVFTPRNGAPARCMAASMFSAISIMGSHRICFFCALIPFRETIAEIPDFQLRITIWDSRETRLTLRVEKRKLAGCIVEQGGLCLLRPEKVVSAAYGKILELGLSKDLFELQGRRELLLSVAIWRGGLPLDILPAEGMLNIALGEENFAW